MLLKTSGRGCFEMYIKDKANATMMMILSKFLSKHAIECQKTTSITRSTKCYLDVEVLQ